MVLPWDGLLRSSALACALPSQRRALRRCLSRMVARPKRYGRSHSNIVCFVSVVVACVVTRRGLGQRRRRAGVQIGGRAGRWVGGEWERLHVWCPRAAVLFLVQMVTVVDGESFVSFIPGPYARVSGKCGKSSDCFTDILCGVSQDGSSNACIAVGVDYAEEAAVIGRQWFSWSPDDPGWQQEDSFISALAPARLVFPSSQVICS